MKTSIKSIMMGMALTGCLIFSASDAIAQGRIRSQASGGSSNRNQSATVSSSNNTTAPTVVNSQTPQVNRNDKIRVSRRDESQNNGTGNSGTSIRKGDATTRTSTSTQDGTDGNGSKPGNGEKPNGGGNSDKPGNGGGSSTTPRPNDSGPSTPPRPNDDSPSMPPPPDGGGPSMPPPPDGGGPGVQHPIPVEICPCLPLSPLYVGSIGYSPEHPYDYSINPHYSEFSWNYEHHNWSRPMIPPARFDRPSFRGWFRPVIPAGWHSNIGAPIIDGILGIPFGTFADDALDYLYSNGYFIDGYANSIIYLRSVPLLNMTWDDVMLAFNTQGRLVNAEFVIRTTYCINHCHSTSCPCRTIHNRINNHFYNGVYRHLCEIFGTPIKNGSGSLSWYGGNDTGWITLLTYTNSGNYYIMLSIGN